MSFAQNTSFSEMLPGGENDLISGVVKDNYEVVYGNWPQNYDEVVIVVNSLNEIEIDSMYELGYLPNSEYKELMEKFKNLEEFEVPQIELAYDEVVGKEFYIFTKSDEYEKSSDGLFQYIGDNSMKLENRLDSATKIKVVGIIKAVPDASNAMIRTPVAYTNALTLHLIEHSNSSEVVKAQEASPEVNVLTGLSFSPATDEQKCEDARTYLSNLGVSDKAEFITEAMKMMYGDNAAMMGQIEDKSETELAEMFDTYMGDPDDETLLQIYDMVVSPGSYDDNLASFGKTDLNTPTRISIYADTFEDKDNISRCIEDYNKGVDEKDKIVYTDYVGLLLSSVTTIINVISYVLIAFVAVSLVVSSIMIGIITYISVLERTKEIGILRAIGASKKNISLVFNAETFIIGLCSGLIGVGISLLALIPANMIIHNIADRTDVNAVLPPIPAIILVVLSIILTLIGGLIPSRKASNMDPVAALRTE